MKRLKRAFLTSLVMSAGVFAEDDVFGQTSSALKDIMHSIASLAVQGTLYAIALAPIFLTAWTFWQVFSKRRELQMANQTNPTMQAIIETAKSSGLAFIIYAIVLVLLGIFTQKNPLSLIASIYNQLLGS